MSTSTAIEQFDLWDEKTLAEKLQVSVRTVQGWRARRTGPKWVKLGGAVRYRPATVARWMEELEEESNAKAAS